MGLLRPLLNFSQQPTPEILKTPMADCATGFASAKIKTMQVRLEHHISYTSPFVEQEKWRYLLQSKARGLRA